jgi:predicted  nucleic acid-binding Zn-ribbon protein
VFFGYRTPTGRDTIVQSWCRKCRALEQATSPRKKQRLPDDVRELGIQARDLHKQADAKAEERAKVLAGSKGRETKESVELLVEEQDLRTEAVRLLSEYDQKRGILRKAKKATN